MAAGTLIGNGWLRITADTTSATHSLGTLGAAAGTAAKAGIGALVGFGGAAVTMGVKTAASLEQAQIGFSSLMGSASKAKDFLADLKSFAASTPFELPGLIDSSRKLIGVGLSAKDTMATLQAFGDTAGAVGVGQEAFSRIILATSQSISAGKITLGDMNQLMENGLPIWKLLSEAIGKPVPKIKDMITHGKLMTNDVLPKLRAQMEKDYGGAMAKQSQTLNGLWSTLMDTFNLGMADVITPLMPMLKDGLAGAIKLVGDVTAGIPKVVGAASDALGPFIGWVTKTAIPQIKTFFSGLLGKEQKISLPPAVVRFGQGGMVKNKIALATELGREVRSVFSKALGSGVVKEVEKAYTDLFSSISDFFGGISGKKMKTTLAPSAIQFGQGGMIKNEGSQVRQFGDRIRALFENGFKGVDWNKVGQTLGEGLGKAFFWVASHAEAVGAALAKVISKINFIALGLAMADFSIQVGIGFFKAFDAGMRQFAVNIAGDMLVIGRNLVEGLYKGTIQALGGVGQWIDKHLVQPIVNATKHLFGIGSPARVMIPIGADIIRGLFTGMLNVAKSISGWLRSHVYNPINNAFRGAGSWLSREGRSVINGLISGMGGIARSIGGWLRTNVYNRINGFFSGARSWLSSEGSVVINGLWDGLKKPWGSVKKWVSGIAQWIKDHKGPISLDSQLLHPAGVALMTGLLNGLKFGFGPVGDFVYKTGSTIASITKKIATSLFTPLAGGQGVNRWKNVVLQALKMVGQPASLLGTVLRRMNQESGGNPNIVNKWDSNWQAGHPSVGLMQVIRGTYAAYAGQFRDTGPFLYGVSTNPLANIYASMRYAMSRYGSLAAAYNRAGGYDSGGWLMPGMTLAYNGTGRPERIRTAEQEAALGAGSLNVTFINQGVIGSSSELEQWLVNSLDSLGRRHRVPASFIRNG